MAGQAPRKLKINMAEAFTPLMLPMRHKAWHGGRGTAKSHHFAEALVVHSMMDYEFVLCARQFQNSISESAKGLIVNKIQKLDVAPAFRIMDREIVHITTDSRFIFRGLERNPESIKSLEGCTKCWIEEARSVNQRSMDIVIPTIRDGGSECWWSWNPKFKTDPVDMYFRGDVVPQDAIVREVSYLDNPWWFHTEMPKEKALMARANIKKHDHIWGGAYDEVGEARIFTNTRVGRLSIPDNVAPVFGIDFGSQKSTSDPNAGVKVYVLLDTRQIYIAQEAYGRTSLLDLPNLLWQLREIGDYTAIADSSRPETIDYLNTHHEYRFNVVAARKGPGSVKAGIEWLQGFEIVIDPDCPRMQDEAKSYCWKVDPYTNLILPIPVDSDNHLWDGVRYATECYRDGTFGGVQIIGGAR